VAPYEANAVLKNAAGIFTDVAASSGAADSRAARGAILVDLDSDAAMDVVQTNTNGSAVFLHNVTSTGGGWLRATLTGRRSNREGRGAYVKVTAGGTTRLAEVGSSTGFASTGEVSTLFGLGSATYGDLEARWPLGTTQRLYDVAQATHVTLVEPAVTAGAVTPNHTSVAENTSVSASTTLTNATGSGVPVSYRAELHADGLVLATGSPTTITVGSSGGSAISCSVTVPANASGGANRAARLVVVVTEGMARTEAMVAVTITP